MKYVIGYSGGKDCTFTIEKLKEEGHELVGIVALVSDDNISFNHCLTLDMCNQYASALGVKLYPVICDSVFDQKVLASGMIEMKQDGVEAIAYGATHVFYNEMSQMASRAGLKLFAPLFHSEEENLMEELLKRNYKMMLINVSKSIPFANEIIGKYIDKELIDRLRKEGKDISGNDGSYHSQVVDCPLFKNPIKLPTPRIVELNNRIIAVFE